MRCIGCGKEMRLVQAVADQTMMVPGYEHQTLECAGCHVVERRLVFARPIGPLSVEPMRLHSGTQSPAAAPTQNESNDIPRTWTRAIERLRGQQSALKERAAAARTSETVRQFYQAKDGFMPRRSDGSPVKKSKSAERPTPLSPAEFDSGKDKARPGAASGGALARVVAKLRSRQAAINGAEAVNRHALEAQPFDQLWESLGPSPRRPTPSGKPSTPRPRPLAKSRSLVPIDARPEEASSAWARAVAMLQGRRDSGL